MDWIVTGASRGIGRALVDQLARAAGEHDRVFALARTPYAASPDDTSARVIALSVDLGTPRGAREAGEALAPRVSPGATLIHNAGVWPTRRELAGGLEAAFALNCLSPLALQAPLLEAGCLARVLAIGAGLMAFGRFDPVRTPRGDDFSRLRTYATTKLAGAVALRAAARRHPTVDLAVIHPGVVDTALGASPGVIGWLLGRIKRRWERPETCAARLVRVLARPRWQTQPGEAPWFVEEERRPWPAVADRCEAAVEAAVAEAWPQP